MSVSFLKTATKMLGITAFFLLVCSFPGIFSFSEEMQELIDTLHNTCVGETGVDEGLIERARKGDFADDDKLRCYMKCLLEQMACIDDEGIIDIDATVAVLPEEYQEKGQKIIGGCGTKDVVMAIQQPGPLLSIFHRPLGAFLKGQGKLGANPCDNAFLTNKCWYEADPESYFLV